jgi:hypothetical protein
MTICVYILFFLFSLKEYNNKCTIRKNVCMVNRFRDQNFVEAIRIWSRRIR